MINVAVICTFRGLPMMAEVGFLFVFYYLVTVLVFLIPVSLISAELATVWPKHGPGGVYWETSECGDGRGGHSGVSLRPDRRFFPPSQL